MGGKHLIYENRKPGRMKLRAVILQALQDLFVIFMFTMSVLGTFKMWTDPEYAVYLFNLMQNTLGSAQTPEVVTVIHKVFFTTLMLAFTAFLIYVFADNNLIKRIIKNRESDK